MVDEVMDKKAFYMQSLGLHAEQMYSTLIHESNVVSENVKIIDEFKDTSSYPLDVMRGYFARKGKVKYWIPEELFPHLPIKTGSDVTELKYKDDLVLLPNKPTPFKITPEETLSVRALIDSFCPFTHLVTNHWTLMKVIALTSYVSRTYMCIATKSSFGKSSVYDCLHYLTDKTPVFKPRSIPGVLNHINGTGAMVFDEIHKCKKEILNIIEEFALQIGGGKTSYINGALKSANTKSSYNCNLQSISFLYNTIDQYKDPSKEYFDVIFSNNKALDDRFLKLKLDGELSEKFVKEYDVEGVVSVNKMNYISMAKMLLWLQEKKLRNGYTRRFQVNSIVGLSGRRRLTYDDITWLLDHYCNDQAEMDLFVSNLDTAITDYRSMVEVLKDGTVDTSKEHGNLGVEEEFVE